MLLHKIHHLLTHPYRVILTNKKNKMRVFSVFILFCIMTLNSCNKNNQKNEIIKTTYENPTEEEKKSIDKKKYDVDNPEVNFSLEKLQINGYSIFRIPKKEIISKLNLKEDEIEKGFKYYSGANYFLIPDTIVYFEINDREYIISNPNLKIGMNENDLKEIFPNAYKRKSEDTIYDLKLESFEIYDVEDNKIRVYIYQGKIHSLSYFKFEDPYDYPEGF